MLSRVVLAFILTLLFGAHYALQQTPGSTLVIQMSTSASGVVQAFYDTGAGFNESESVKAVIRPGMQTYRLALPISTFRVLRLDPGTAPGVYDIREVAVLSADGAKIIVPLSKLAPAYELTALEQSDSRLLVRCPEGSNDPQLVYAPPRPIVLAISRTTAGVLTVLSIVFVCALGAIIAMERALAAVGLRVMARLRTLADAAARRAGLAVFLAAAFATIASTYPVVFLGRSLVSPNDGGLAMLYGTPPFVPGSSDLTVEDVRASDTGAMMWAFVPYAKIQHEALAGGELPLWDRYNSTGFPLWGQGQSFLLDPLHWLALANRDPAPGLDLKFVAHRMVFASGIGAAALLATGAPIASMIAAGIAPFAGLFTFRFNHPAVFSLTYAPWILVAWFLLARAATTRQAARAALLLAVASSLELVASPPKEATTLLFACHLAGVLTLLIARQPLSVRVGRLALAVAAGVAMTLLTAPHWLIFLDTLHASFTSYDAAAANFAGAPHALAFVLGNVVTGPLSSGLNVVAVTLACAVYAFPLYLGARRPALACAFTAAAVIAIAFGALPKDVILSIPLVANIQQIDQTLLMAALVLVLVLAGSGIDALSRASPPKIAALTGLALAGALWVLSTLQRQTALSYFDLEVTVLVLGLAVLLPALISSASATPTRAVPVLAAGSVMLVLLLPSGLQVETGVAAVDHLLPQPRVRVPLDRPSPVVDVIHRLATEPTRVLGLNLLLFAGTQGLYGLEGISGPDALRREKYEQLLNASGVRREWGWHMMISKADLPGLDPVLDVLNVGFVLVEPDDVPAGVQVPALDGPDLLRAVPRPTAWPRAFFTDHLSEYADVPDFLKLLSEHRAPFAAVQRNDEDARPALLGLAQPTPVTLSSPPDSAPAIPATKYQLTANTTSFQVHAPGPGVAVLTESFMPRDFVATLNGSRARYFRVNHAFKGVLIPAAGDWNVRFEYRPFHWRAALGLSAAGLLILFGIGVVGARAPGMAPAALPASLDRAAVYNENPAARASSKNIFTVSSE